jgi:DNA-directed RNA polymerase subunit E"
MEKACKNCKYITTENVCPNCGGKEFSNKWEGEIHVYDINSKTAKIVNAKVPGIFAIIVK